MPQSGEFIVTSSWKCLSEIWNAPVAFFKARFALLQHSMHACANNLYDFCPLYIPPSFLVLSATWLVWPGSWAWRLSHSLCGHTCQKMPWGLQWWRSAFLQGRGPWPRAESFQLTRRKQGKQHKATKKEDTTWIKKNQSIMLIWSW